MLAELSYLVLINGALQLPLTQDLVNSIRPQKFRVSWDEAWSWYPVRVHVRGLAADGQSRSQQWQLKADTASASVSLLPLLVKRVWIHRVRATNIDYRQRPRLRPDKDYDTLLPHFPQIGDRDVVPVEEMSRKKKSPWHISVKGIEANGNHYVWVFQLSALVRGRLAGELTFETRGGPFSLDLPEVALEFSSAYLNGDHEVLSGGTLNGALGFSPFVPRENRGVAMLSYLHTDVKADLDLNDLSFLDLFLLKLDGVSVNGKGRVKGALRLDDGSVVTGTRLGVEARELLVSAFAHEVEGEGEVILAMGAKELDEKLYLGFLYKGLTVRSARNKDELLTGDDLGLIVRGNGQLLPDEESPDSVSAMEFSVAAITVPDLALLQGYLPARLPLTIHGGRGVLRGSARIGSTSLSVDAKLNSDRADLSLREFRFNSNLDVAIKLDNPDITTQATTVDGSSVSLSNSRIQRGANAVSDQWDTRFDIEQGLVSLSGDPAIRQADGVGDLLRYLNGAEASDLLAQVWAQLDLSAYMSRLDWIAALIKPEHGIHVNGSGHLQGKFQVSGGELQPPSWLKITSDDLSVDVLDYVSRGSGVIDILVEEGPPQPLWSLDIELEGGSLQRQSDEVSQIEDVELALGARMTTTEDEDKPIQAEELEFSIASARVRDMAAFNSYLPKDGSIAFTGGVADLTASIRLLQRDAEGWLKLISTDTSAVVTDQSVRGDVLLDVKLANGIPKEMAFDISGSVLRLDNVHIEGDRAGFNDLSWSAQLALERGHAVWRKTPLFRAEGNLTISDTRPVVTMFENGGWRPNFISRMLTIEDIEGEAILSMADDIFYIENAEVLSDKLELRAQGSLSKGGRDAMIYLRYKRLDGVLKYLGQDRNLDIINARKTYDNFQPEFPPAANL